MAIKMVIFRIKIDFLLISTENIDLWVLARIASLSAQNLCLKQKDEK